MHVELHSLKMIWEPFQCWSQFNLTPASGDFIFVKRQVHFTVFCFVPGRFCFNTMFLWPWKTFIMFYLAPLALSLLHEIWTRRTFNSIINENTEFSQQRWSFRGVAVSGSIETLLSCRERHGRAELSQSGGECHVNTLGHTVFMKYTLSGLVQSHC